MSIRFDRFELDPETGELRKAGENVKLKPPQSWNGKRANETEELDLSDADRLAVRRYQILELSSRTALAASHSWCSAIRGLFR